MKPYKPAWNVPHQPNNTTMMPFRYMTRYILYYGAPYGMWADKHEMHSVEAVNGICDIT